MNRLTVSSVALIILHSVISAVGHVKITPIAVDNKSNLKSDLKVEEARYQNPIMPEYYGGNSYDRNRENFITSSYGSYGTGLSNYDRNSAYDRYGSSYDRYGSNYGSNYDRYGSLNRDRIPVSLGNPLYPETKFNYMPGGTYNPSTGPGGTYGNNGGTYGNSYGSRPYEGGSYNGPYAGPGGMSGMGGMFPQDFDSKKSLILPLAGAALLGIAAYTLVSNPGFAMGGAGMMGKRRKRSLFDEKLEQHLAYRAHQKKVKRSVK